MRNFISCYYSELITPIALEKSKKKKCDIQKLFWYSVIT